MVREILMNKHTAQLQFDRLKIDQVSPLSIFGLIGKAGYQYRVWYGTSKIIVNKANTSMKLIQCPPICL